MIIYLRCLLGAIALFLLPSGMATASSDGGADLNIPLITWSPEFPLTGDQVSFRAVIKNRGSAAAGASAVTWYIDEVPAVSGDVPPIGPGDTAEVYFTWQAKRGTHTVTAMADSGAAVDESDEGNNTYAAALYVLDADLIVQDVSWSPENASVGDKVTFNIAVKNQGGIRAGSSSVELIIDGNSRGYREVPAIEPGATAETSFVWYSQPGEHAIKVIADVLERVPESDETNNRKEFTYATATPDLVVAGVTWTPANPAENVPLDIVIRVANNGTGRAEPSILAYYIDDSLQGSAFVGRIEPGGNVDVGATWTVAAGLHTIRAFADFKQEIIESDETNNETTVTLPGVTADLVVQKITWSPSGVLPGQTFDFVVELLNQGGVRASLFRVYLNIEGVGRLQQDVAALDPGTSITVRFPWTVGSFLYRVEAVADPENLIPESDESNNSRQLTAVLNLAQRPDLTSEITWTPANPGPGDNVVFRVNVTNQGGRQSDPFHIAGYIDGAPLSPVYVKDLASGETVTTTYDWVALWGPHSFRAVADSNRVVAESDEANNEKTVTLVINAPDLVVKSITPATPAGSGEAAVVVTVENRGDLAAGRSYLAFYVDESFKGYHNLPPIEAGGSLTDTFSFAEQPGKQTIRVVADASNSIIESDETNNQRKTRFPFPDLVARGIAVIPPQPSPADLLTIRAAIENTGNSLAEDFEVEFLVDDTTAGRTVIREITPGGTAEAHFTWQASPGSYRLTVLADRLNAVDESDESNNEVTTTLVIEEAAGAPQSPPVTGGAPPASANPAQPVASASPRTSSPAAATNIEPPDKAQPLLINLLLQVWWVLPVGIIIVGSALVLPFVIRRRPKPPG